ncbi:MerC family mercury resistance protein [Sphingopyxis sp. RIFCSPHIGHO2_12_FULL_65_19]|uniref:MerC family mercury resistance protein n=1 Tax=Sphingopyxis sp. RIFCSPHIGHO2_12_FULL_65_19 TaxID=1802172 RepID=UPI000A5D9A3C|nr:MerC family mercury resistance protein [Sphingopyxis sp. RIFCSPHIGHO2_12_FULL_65_19]
MCLPAARPRLADLMGLALSLSCLLHCLALPLLLLLAPALSRWIALPEGVHAAILMLALPAAAIAMRDGWRRHRRIVPAMLAAAGLGLLALGLLAHEGWMAAADPEAADRMLTSMGALVLAAAHLLNWRWRHRGGAHRLAA